MIQVVKRDGSKEPLNIDKIHVVVEFACEGISGVSPSEVEIQSKLQFYNNIKTNDIHETLINAAGKLISEESPNYQFVAARLLSYHLRKQVYGSYKPDKLFSHYKRVRDLGFYTTELGTAFRPEEWAELNSYIKHERDDIIPFIGMEQFRSKYLVRNRATKEILETPQMALMLIAMTLFMDDIHDDINKRINLIKEFYDTISTYEATLPSPIMAGVRTPEKQFASCILVDSDDSLDSIIATNGVIVKYVSKKAGLGIGATKLRAVNDPVRGGAVVHTGSIPFIKTFESSILSCSQGSMRRGSGTVNLLGWHLEFEDHISLKGNKGTEENSIRQLDYVIQLNRVLYERLLTGGNITLFSPKDHPEMYDAFYTDIDKFRELYEKAERSRCRKKTLSASDYFSALIRERKETGRVYIMNVDNVNNQSGYIKERCPVVMTNLCVAGETLVDVIVDSIPFYGAKIKDIIALLVEGKNIQILSENLVNNKKEYKNVTAGAMTSNKAKVLKIKYSGKELICTPEHRIYTKNRGYVAAKDLITTDELMI